jgi:K+-sensing histidine kinase KdpD
MKIGLLLIAGNDEQYGAVAIDAATNAFPGAAIGRARSIDEALERGRPCVPEILVMLNAGEADIARADQALDDAELPRWAVVALGESSPPPFAEVIAHAGWERANLVRVFRRVVANHMVRRERDRLRGDMLSMGIRVTHDLRTSLGGILASSEALRESSAANPAAESELAQPIAESTQDLVRVIGQLSVIAKASGATCVMKPFNMGEPVCRAVQRIELRASREGSTVLKPDAWPEVTGDPSKTESIWQGLLENAVKYAGSGALIELGWEPAGRAYRFWVRDNGKGVPQDKRRLLFQPFHRLHETSAARGLGLAVVERLVSLQGGACGYQPGEAGGSCFYFTLPFSGAA